MKFNLSRKNVEQSVLLLRSCDMNEKKILTKIVDIYDLHVDTFINSGDFYNSSSGKINLEELVNAIPKTVINTPMARYIGDCNDVNEIENMTKQLYDAANTQADSSIYVYILNRMIVKVAQSPIEHTCSWEIDMIKALINAYANQRIDMEELFEQLFKLFDALYFEAEKELDIHEIMELIKEHYNLFWSIANGNYNEHYRFLGTFDGELIKCLFTIPINDAPYLSDEVLSIMLSDGIADIERCDANMYADRLSQIINDEQEGDNEFNVLTNLFSDIELLDNKLSNFNLLMLEYPERDNASILMNMRAAVLEKE